MGEASLAMARRRVLAAGLFAAALVPCGSLILAGEADAPRMRQVGFCSTGFGVPGSGRPFVFGTQVLLNAGEGCPTVYDVSNPRAPRVLRHIPTWFFTTFIYPLPSRDLVYLSSSRGPLLVLKGLSTWGRKGDVKEIPWQSSWGRSFLSAIRPDGVAYTVASEHIVVLDLNDPDRPKEIARIPQPRLRKTKSRAGAGLLTFTDDCRLAAATFDGGARIALLRWTSATQCVLSGELANSVVRDKARAAHGRVLAMDKGRLVIGVPASTSKYWRTFKLIFWDIRDAARPQQAGELVFQHPGTHIRDVALAGRYAFIIDGRNIHSGHTVRRTQRSRLIVLDLSKLAAPKIVATFVESMPTEYSQMTLHARTLYVNDYNYGLWIFDVTDPRKPAKLGGAPASAEGHWLYLHGDHAFVAHTFGGTIHVINVADPRRPKTVGYYWDGQWLNYKAKIRGKGDAMYLPQFDGLAVVDIGEPARPKRVGEFLDAEGKPLQQPCIDVLEEHAFVATAPSGKTPGRLLVYDLAQPLKPRLLSATKLPGSRGFRVLAAGKMLYLVGYKGERFVAIDASNPKEPRITAELSASEFRLGDQTYSLAVRDGGGNGAPGVACAGGYLYVVTGKPAPDEPYLLIFDVRDPSAIRPAGVFHVRGRKGWQYFICDVIAAGNRLILGDYGCDEVYDIRNPLRPKRLAQYRRSYAWQIGTLRGKYLYVPKLDGLEILEVPLP